MTTIQLIALQPFHLDGRPFASGDPLEVSPVQALALTYQRKARFLRRDEVPAPTRKKRTYKRRDLTAEE